jgi:hypothetical protein
VAICIPCIGQCLEDLCTFFFHLGGFPILFMVCHALPISPHFKIVPTTVVLLTIPWRSFMAMVGMRGSWIGSSRTHELGRPYVFLFYPYVKMFLIYCKGCHTYKAHLSYA